MSQVMQMTRHVTSWLGWTPASSCDGLPAAEEEDPIQESSGFVTVLILYLGMAGFFAALNLFPRDKRERRQVQRLERQGRESSYSSLPLTWLVNLTSLICEVAAPRRPSVFLQQQRLRMRLLRQKEQELVMAAEWQELPTWQDVLDDEGEEKEEAEEEQVEQPVAAICLMPKRQKSTYFDLPSESE
ncbi:uncharacterized protein [Drosophila takahashii]|uniref:uncharacterized protein n=1 Tax=Drosophila takahashii TaxID=29030 RepID=UPI001CF92B7E|nr:uncharacterized protein LOC108070141 [Drosophila takahashii]